MVLIGSGIIRKIFILLLFGLLLVLIILSNKSNNLLILVNKNNPIGKGYSVNLRSYENFYVAKELIEPLKRMNRDLEQINMGFEIEEAYVSVKMQEQRFNTKVKKYESLGMDKIEAKMETAKTILVPRYSEHHTGLALKFKGSEELYTWLEQNAYKYGFILRYPKDKEEITGFIYDKTHYRYVGVENATKMYNQNLCLEEYLKEE